jgi:hypothetical protein
MGEKIPAFRMTQKASSSAGSSNKVYYVRVTNESVCGWVWGEGLAITRNAICSSTASFVRLFIHEDESTTARRNTGNYSPNDTATRLIGMKLQEHRCGNLRSPIT